MNILDQLKANVIHHLKSDENVLREYNSLLEHINKECVYNEIVLHVFDDMEVADKVGRCFKLQGFDVRIIAERVRPVLCVSGWDCEIKVS